MLKSAIEQATSPDLLQIDYNLSRQVCQIIKEHGEMYFDSFFVGRKKQFFY